MSVYDDANNNVNDNADAAARAGGGYARWRKRQERLLGAETGLLGTDFEAPSDLDLLATGRRAKTTWKEDQWQTGVDRAGSRIARFVEKHGWDPSAATPGVIPERAPFENRGGQEGAEGYDWTKEQDWQTYLKLQDKWSQRSERLTGLRDAVARIKDLQQQAKDAEAAGDHDTAMELANQAAELARGTEGISFKKTTDVRAREAASASKPFMLVSGLVKDAAELNTDEGRDRYIHNITDPAVEAIQTGRDIQRRSLAAQQRSSIRQARDLGLVRGSSNVSENMAAVMARVGERYAAADASVQQQASAAIGEVMGKAAAYYEDFSRQWTQSVAEFSQAFVQNEAGVRDLFNAEMQQAASLKATTLLNVAAQYNAQAGNAINMTALQLQDKYAAQEGQLAKLGLIIGAATSIYGSTAEAGAKAAMAGMMA